MHPPKEFAILAQRAATWFCEIQHSKQEPVSSTTTSLQRILCCYWTCKHWSLGLENDPKPIFARRALLNKDFNPQETQSTPGLLLTPVEVAAGTLHLFTFPWWAPPPQWLPFHSTWIKEEITHSIITLQRLDERPRNSSISAKRR